MFSLAMRRSVSAIVEPFELEVAAGLRAEGSWEFVFVFFTYCLFVDDSAKPGLGLNVDLHEAEY